MNRKICVVTGSRADYGLLRQSIVGIDSDAALELQVIATGMHLSPEFGLTYREIEYDGIRIDRKLETLTSSDTAIGVGKSTGLGIIGFSDALAELRPDVMVILGDRYEILAAAFAALVQNIPIAHLHGGELTEGAFDDSIRHSITKMAQLHFVASEQYRARVLQLGEQPERVFNVGGFGVDAIQQTKLLSRDELEKSLKFEFGDRNLLVTFHPATLERSCAEQQMEELLAALGELSQTRLIFTMPNSDTEGRAIARMVRSFVESNPNARAFESLGQQRYFSVVSQVDGVVGNSSSGIAEVPSFKKPTVNIGDRQRGRVQASSIINCEPVRSSITSAIQRLYSEGFQASIGSTTNPYGDGGASRMLIETLREFPLSKLSKKKFYDLNAGQGI